MLTSKANKIFIDEILPLVTKVFSSITSELMTHPQYWNDEDETIKKIYEEKGKAFVSDFKKYVEGTVKLQYEILTVPAVIGEKSIVIIKEYEKCQKQNT